MKNLSWSGIAVISAGVLALFTNAVLIPFVPFGIGVTFTEAAASPAFLWRLSLASLVAFLLMIGSVGLYQYQSRRSGHFGSIAFGLAFLGSALLFAHEWSQVFFIHDMAIQVPGALDAMEDAKGFTLFDIESMITSLTFMIGWIAFSISMLVTGVYTRLGPILVIAGFFAIPILSAILPQLLGMIVGNVVLASGWILLGRELIKNSTGLE